MRVTTTDLYESGFLLCAGVHLADIWNERHKASTVIFVFDDCRQSEGRLEELQRSYHNGTATVNLAEYRQSLEEVKDRMFAVLRKENGTRTRRNRNACQQKTRKMVCR
jgi:hypothetical protein